MRGLFSIVVACVRVLGAHEFKRNLGDADYIERNVPNRRGRAYNAMVLERDVFRGPLIRDHFSV